MGFENQSREVKSREQIEQERKESFAGSNHFIKDLSPAELHEPSIVAQICKDVSNWALTYRGYKDTDDSFYELVTQLSEKLGEYAAVNPDSGENFVADVTRIVDETFPTVEQAAE